MAVEDVDVLIVGAGLSGIGAACHLRRRCPQERVAILEARASLGGTWDLFRYPGVRSDSDMYTLGYSFRPWRGRKAITDGPSIRAYLADTARDEGVDELIRYGERAVRAAWDSGAATWTVDVLRSDGTRAQLRARFLLMCTGYYEYASGYTPEFPGREQFQGRIVHPQAWDERTDYAGRRVVVIGSGATAVTLVPALAARAAHVTMLQRSPSYLVTRPTNDRLARLFVGILGPRAGAAVARWKNLLLAGVLYAYCRRFPARAKARLVAMVRDELGPAYDVEKHFTPAYDPWRQRVCLVADGDFFAAVRAGRAEVVTDRIETFTRSGIRLASGAELPADIVVTATGLRMQVLSGVDVVVDGRRIEPKSLVSYKGVMFGGVPNFASVFGYFNASWTLKADLASEYVCRVLNRMRSMGARRCCPTAPAAFEERRPWSDFSSGYVARALEELPGQGTKRPWALNEFYLLDWLALRFGRLDDGVLTMSR